MDNERFKGKNILPDPVMGSDNPYVPFADVYGTDTSDNKRSSLTQRRKMKTLTYSPSEQHARNAGVLVQCDECDKWRLLFSKRKLSATERTRFQGTIEDESYSCCATIDDLILPDTLKNVGIKSQIDSDPIEMMYYSAYKDDLICIHCGSPNDLNVSVDSDTLTRTV